MKETADIRIKGLHCVDCVNKVERGLSSVPGIGELNLNFTTRTLHVEYDGSIITLDEIHARIRSLGHEVLEEEVEEEEKLFSLENRSFVFAVISGIALFAGLLLKYTPDGLISDATVLEPGVFHDIQVSGILFFIAMFFGGFHVARSAITGLRNRIFVIDLLMIIGATGAVLLGEFAEGAAVLFLFSLAELLEDYSVDRSRRSLRELVGLKPVTVFLKKDGGLVEVRADEVGVGDIAQVRPGERIGVDGVVVNGCSMVNQAPITGESMPVSKDKGDTVFAGTINQNGRLEIRVEKEAKDSALARIIQMVESAEEHKAETERFVDRFSKYFTPSVVVMAVLVATIPALLLDQSFELWIYKALLLLLISCPCALALSTPISIVSGITSGAKQGILFKGGAHLEKLEGIDTFAFDKTGTLTEGRPVVTDVIPLNGYTRENVLATAASLESLSKHPLGNAIVELARKENVKLHQVSDLSEKTGKGVEGVIHGERCVVGSGRLFESTAMAVLDEINNNGTNSNGSSNGSDSSDKSDKGDNSSSSGGTSGSSIGSGNGGVLSRLEDQAKTAVLVGKPGRVMGVIGISDKIRDGAREMVQSLRELGIRHMAMVTGDNERTARAVAREVGIDDYYAELLPEEKVAVIDRLKGEKGERGEHASIDGSEENTRTQKHRANSGVAMVGDGVNDAPALVTADLGIAMGAAGSDTALEVADIALMDEELSKLPVLLSLGRKTMKVIKQNIALAIGVKLLFAILVFPGLVTLWMAVAIGDMGVSLAVIGNALRLTRSGKDRGAEDIAGFGYSKETDQSRIGPEAGVCATTSCYDACCADETNGEEEPGKVGSAEHHDGCCEESTKEAPVREASGCSDRCCGDDENGTEGVTEEPDKCGCGHDHD